MNRREALKTVSLVGIANLGTVRIASAEDADPRPEPYAGELPNDRVRATKVDPLPCGVGVGTQNHIAPAGDWIHHRAGWVSQSCEDNTDPFLDRVTTIFTIDGEEFVLESADDWDLLEPPKGYNCLRQFNYSTPPKPNGETYEFKWETLNPDGSPFGAFPFSSEIKIVQRKDAVSDCTGEELA